MHAMAVPLCLDLRPALPRDMQIHDAYGSVAGVFASGARHCAGGHALCIRASRIFSLAVKTNLTPLSRSWSVLYARTCARLMACISYALVETGSDKSKNKLKQELPKFEDAACEIKK